jgi:hypothetical protein
LNNSSHGFLPALRSPLNNPFYNLVTGLFGLIVFLGCDREPMVRVYEAPKDAIPEPPRMASAAKANRLLIGVVPHQGDAYFIKATDPPVDAQDIETGLRQIVARMKPSSNGEVDWGLPEGWTAKPGSGISMAELEAPQTDRPVLFVVTKLPGPQSPDEVEPFLESNLNRWRGQVGLAEASLSEQGSNVSEESRGNGQLPGFIVKLRREETSDEDPSTASDKKSVEPESIGEKDKNADQQIDKKSTGASGSTVKKGRVTYEVPEGWKEEPASGMREASFKIPSDDETGDVSVIFASGDLNANIVRWQNELAAKLAEKPSDDAIDQAAKKSIEEAKDVKSQHGLSGKLYTLFASPAPNDPATLGAIFPIDSTNGASLFVKLRGNRRLIESQREAFEKLLASLAW